MEVAKDNYVFCYLNYKVSYILPSLLLAMPRLLCVPALWPSSLSGTVHKGSPIDSATLPARQPPHPIKRRHLLWSSTPTTALVAHVSSFSLFPLKAFGQFHSLFSSSNLHNTHLHFLQPSLQPHHNSNSSIANSLSNSSRCSCFFLRSFFIRK